MKVKINMLLEGQKMAKTVTKNKSSSPKAKAKSPGKISTSRVSKQPSTKTLPGVFGGKYGKVILVVTFFVVIGLVTLLRSLAAVSPAALVGQASGKCLDNFFARQANGNYVSIYPCTNNNPAQQWYVENNTIHTKEGYCLEVLGSSKVAQTPIDLRKCNSSVPGQKWVRQANKTFKNPNSNQCMQVSLAKTATGTGVWLAVCNGNPAQVWNTISINVPTNPPTPTPPPTSGPGTSPAGSVDISAACRNPNPSVANGTTVRGGYANNGSTGPQVAGLSETRLPRATSGPGWSASGGTLTVNTAGAVVSGVYHNGIVRVNADNVTIRNSVICGGGTEFIVQPMRNNLVIENSILRGERGKVSPGGRENGDGQPCGALIGFPSGSTRWGYTIRNSEVTGCADGLKTVGRVVMTGNWFHDNYIGCGTNTRGKYDCTHNDTIQQDNGNSSTFVFENNSAYQSACKANRHFQMAPDKGGPYSAPGLRIRNNFFYGMMGYNFSRGFTAPGGSISGNKYAGSATQGPFFDGSADKQGSPLIYAGSSPGISGNTFESGQPANSNPGGSYKCIAG